MAERKMIRFDDDDSAPVAGNTANDPPEHEQVKLHSCEEIIIIECHGFRYQKCGGGRRRLGKRSN